MSECALILWACDQDAPSASAGRVLIQIARHVDADGVCAVTQTELGRECKLTDRQVRTLIRALIDARLVTRVRAGGEGKGREADRYTLLREQPEISSGSVATGSESNVTVISACPPATGRFFRQQPEDFSGQRQPEIPPKDNNQTPREIYPEPLELGSSVAAAQPRATPADRIIAAVGSPFLDPSKSHGLVTRGAIVAGWLNLGIPEPLIVATIAAICERQAAPIGSWRYFDAAVRQAAADAEPAPITVEFSHAQRSEPYARAAAGRPRSVLAAMASDLGRFSGK